MKITLMHRLFASDPFFEYFTDKQRFCDIGIGLESNRKTIIKIIFALRSYY